MTVLYRISIEDKTDATVRGRFYMINPDAGILPEADDESILLQIMLDAWERMRDGMFDVRDDLTADRLPIPFEEAAAIADGHVLRDAFAKELDDDAEVDTEPELDYYDRFDEIIESSGWSAQRNRPAFWEADGFWDTATDDDFPEDANSYPYVEFTFTAADAQYVAHLVPGTHWATAQYLD
ncbi:hypothetical protein [Actinomadura verrucosospora]|uniref:Uncharacterized protein n=1 Tax=Actinomadura verrucosospora TaxID=46165 RepID=A0A7D3W0X2_ACTVE|nr:hypothetical protein [Actinomadura verrucosospora]QKG26879.1 hypothetical protein ACTIVE_8532 [Actinomadura verrucosospora]